MKESIMKEPGAARTENAEVSKILRQRMESTLDRIEGLAQSGQTISEGAHELAFQVQNQTGEVPPGATALPGLATALYDLFEKIGKGLDYLKEEIEALREAERDVRGVAV